jgi:DNA-binding NarL/FixJ family response regulator
MMDYTNTHQSIDIDEIDASFGHKLKRIKKQENFKHANNYRFESQTKREVEILFLLANDFNNPQIADELFISRYTVEQHRKNINKKLSTHSYSQLFQYALAFNLV